MAPLSNTPGNGSSTTPLPRKLLRSTAARARGAVNATLKAVLRRLLPGIARAGVRVNSFTLAKVALTQTRSAWRANLPIATGEPSRRATHCEFDCDDEAPVIRSRFFQRAAAQPRVSLVQIRHGFADANGLVTDAGGQAVNAEELDQTHMLGNWDLAQPFPRIQRCPGAILAMSHRYQWNYFHWLFDVLPRLAVADAASVHWDRVHVAQEHAFQRDSLALLGIEAQKIIALESRPCIQADALLAVSWWNAVADIPPWACHFLRSRMSTPALPGTSRPWIYISRRDAWQRRVSNEDEVNAVLDTFGIQNVALAQMTLREQIALFSSAQVVIAPHGAGLANIVFCAPGATIVELSAPRYLFGCWHDLAGKCGHDYFFLGGPDIDLQVDHGWKHQRDDFIVDVNKLERLLARLSHSLPGSRADRSSASSDAPAAARLSR